MSKESQQTRIFYLLSGILLLVFLALNMVNDRFEMWDLKVYYDALEQMKAGNSPYGQAFGLSSGFYKYSPMAAYLFYPLSLLGWTATKIIYYLLIGASMIVLLPKILLHVQTYLGRIPQAKSILIPLMLLLLFLGGHLARELYLGNVNWLLFIGLLLVHKYRKSNGILSGLILGVLLAFKPHFVFILPWLVMRKEAKALLATGLSFGALLVMPALFLGWTENLNLLREWLLTMQGHNVALYDSPNTIYYLLSHLSLNLISGNTIIVLSLALVAFSILFWMMRHFRKEKEEPKLREVHSNLEFFTITALIPNLVHTDTEHFLWSTIIIALMILLTYQEKKRMLFGVMLLALIPFSLNTPDLWGRAGVELLNQSGSLGIANLLMILSTLFVFEKGLSSTSRATS
ncbi:MAG: DUF2029 domain-containing protein [Flavobacteriaceae bacterium]|nr:DUF2029 domain-containing protein [Flavobacteriaceae bacterium]